MHLGCNVRDNMANNTGRPAMTDVMIWAFIQLEICWLAFRQWYVILTESSQTDATTWRTTLAGRPLQPWWLRHSSPQRSADSPSDLLLTQGFRPKIHTRCYNSKKWRLVGLFHKDSTYCTKVYVFKYKSIYIRTSQRPFRNYKYKTTFFLFT